MARLKFELWKDDFCKKERGLMATFTDGKGRTSTHWFSSPSKSINHACSRYLQDKFGSGIVRTERHAQFIREQYAKQLQSFPEYNN